MEDEAERGAGKKRVRFDRRNEEEKAQNQALDDSDDMANVRRVSKKQVKKPQSMSRKMKEAQNDREFDRQAYTVGIDGPEDQKLRQPVSQPPVVNDALYGPLQEAKERRSLLDRGLQNLHLYKKVQVADIRNRNESSKVALSKTDNPVEVLGTEYQPINKPVNSSDITFVNTKLAHGINDLATELAREKKMAQYLTLQNEINEYIQSEYKFNEVMPLPLPDPLLSIQNSADPIEITIDPSKIELISSPDSRYVAVIYQGNVEVFEETPGKETHRILQAQVKNNEQVSFTPDSKFLLFYSTNSVKLLLIEYNTEYWNENFDGLAEQIKYLEEVDIRDPQYTNLCMGRFFTEVNSVESISKFTFFSPYLSYTFRLPTPDKVYSPPVREKPTSDLRQIAPAIPISFYILEKDPEEDLQRYNEDELINRYDLPDYKRKIDWRDLAKDIKNNKVKVCLGGGKVVYVLVMLPNGNCKVYRAEYEVRPTEGLNIENGRIVAKLFRLPLKQSKIKFSYPEEVIYQNSYDTKKTNVLFKDLPRPSISYENNVGISSRIDGSSKAFFDSETGFMRIVKYNPDCCEITDCFKTDKEVRLVSTLAGTKYIVIVTKDSYLMLWMDIGDKLILVLTTFVNGCIGVVLSQNHQSLYIVCNKQNSTEIEVHTLSLQLLGTYPPQQLVHSKEIEFTNAEVINISNNKLLLYLDRKSVV